ncbi:hypothetical protein SERLADRAFT_431929 [Serpula lacrymans var. lacrymans S7.9]|nr:uncharacterized protein SERLADRAFT_431929 [Serpula lacrymans var. lacrymans S7.9]EGO30393.1 hypothetical protein SERLADRAFT_431929 [Serpula lacrymans var. lacrymans S7.9]
MDIKYIGSGQAAKALVFYVTDYITKSSLPVHVGLDTLKYAIKQNNLKYMGVSSTSSDKNKSLFMKSMNAIMACQELSHQQAMSYPVGGGDCCSSYAFKLLRWYEFEHYVRKELHEETPDITLGNNNLQNEDYHAFDKTDAVVDSVRRDQKEDLQGEQVFLSVEPNKVTISSELTDYCYRSHEQLFD